MRPRISCELRAEVVIRDDGALRRGQVFADGKALRVEVLVVAEAIAAQGRGDGGVDVALAERGVEQVEGVVEFAGELIGGGENGARGAEEELQPLGFAFLVQA